MRLYFLEPDDLLPGQRVFRVEVQGRPALAKLDIVAETGGKLRGLVKTFENVTIANLLSVTFKRAPGSSHGPVLCGLEMIAEQSAPMSLGSQ